MKILTDYIIFIIFFKLKYHTTQKASYYYPLIHLPKAAMDTAAVHMLGGIMLNGAPFKIA